MGSRVDVPNTRIFQLINRISYRISIFFYSRYDIRFKETFETTSNTIPNKPIRSLHPTWEEPQTLFHILSVQLGDGGVPHIHESPSPAARGATTAFTHPHVNTQAYRLAKGVPNTHTSPPQPHGASHERFSSSTNAHALAYRHREAKFHPYMRSLPPSRRRPRMLFNFFIHTQL